MIQLVFLGTTCMVPTADRNHISVFFKYKGEGFLIDCGEGTQRQMKIAKIPPSDIDRILISHWHGDHVLGLPGLIQTLSASEYNKKLKIYGPKGTKEYLSKMFEAFVFDNKIDIEVIEIKNKLLIDEPDYFVEAYPLEHIIDCYGYSFNEKPRRRINLQFVKKLGIPEGPLLGELQKGNDIVFKGKKVKVDDATYIVHGKKIGFIMDTILTKNCFDIAQNADLLVCEAAFTSKLEEKAQERKHMTAAQAALLAQRAGVKKLVLFHFSQRYKDVNEILEDAKQYFENVICANDFMKIKL